MDGMLPRVRVGGTARQIRRSAAHQERGEVDDCGVGVGGDYNGGGGGGDYGGGNVGGRGDGI